MHHRVLTLFACLVLTVTPIALGDGGRVCPSCGRVHPASAVPAEVSRFVVNRDPRAYSHALREAKILAARRTAGHPLGVAPGCRYSGTGYSWAPRPNHCYYGELSEARLIARAVVRGPNGAYFWSAHYR